MAQTEIKMVGKLTVKSAGANPRKVTTMEAANASVSLCKIFGIADGVKMKEDPISGKTFFPLTGRFQAVNSETGTITRSGILYLPTGIHESYEGAVKLLTEGDVLQFAIELRSVKATNPAGYSYEAIDLMPPTNEDPLTAFAASLSAPKAPAQAQLNAPEPVNQSAPATKVAPTPATKPTGKK